MTALARFRPVAPDGLLPARSGRSRLSTLRPGVLRTNLLRLSAAISCEQEYDEREEDADRDCIQPQLRSGTAVLKRERLRCLCFVFDVSAVIPHHALQLDALAALGN